MKWQDKLTKEEIKHLRIWGLPKGTPLTLKNVLRFVPESLTPGRECRECQAILEKLQPARSLNRKARQGIRR